MSQRRLLWRDGGRGDKQNLDTFCCTTPPVKNLATHWKKVHPREWEYDVQCVLRAASCPSKWPKCLLLGFDDNGLAAVAHYREIDGPAHILIEGMAVALRVRGGDGGHAREMAAEVRDSVTVRAHAAGVREVLVEARVHAENVPSQKLCQDAGMQNTGSLGPDVHVWSYILWV